MTFLGAKSASGAWQQVVAAMPPHDTYIETHLGTGAVLLRKAPAARTIGLEVDAETLDAFPRPAGVELHLGDCVDFLRRFEFAAAGRVVVYADPPYVLATRTSRRRYRHDYVDADHVELVGLLRELPAAVILSGYRSALYEQLAPDWRTLDFQVMTRGGVRTETLWLNFPAGGAVHWAAVAGRDFTDRQRIKRKAARWAANFGALPPAERLAVLSALLDVDAAPAAIDARDHVAGRGRHRRIRP